MPGIYKYPLDQGDYQGRMTFQVVNEDRERPQVIDYGGAGWAAVSAAGGVLGSAVGALGSLGASVASEAANAVGGDEFSNFLGLQKATGSVTFKKAKSEYKGAVQNLQTYSDRKVTLYLPQAIQIQDAVTYDTNVELGALGGGIANSLSGKQSVNLGQAFSAGGARVSNTIKALASGGDISQEQASIATQMILKNAKQGVGDAISAVTGTTANPNTRTLFRQVPIRNFSFTFTLMPTSSQENTEIRNIIKFFREELYPEALSVGDVDYGYRFPNRMIIKLSYRNSEIPGVKFLPVYLQSFNAVYNPNGMGMHRDGGWSEVAITMNFTETKPLAKQDIMRGY